ncbi:MAG TPA: ribose ABC transporter permease, partial [Clostridiales bacterium UBA8960]|nr:ribose ABC transporter permease [Clostridiales bacterium UBA8960]
MKTYIEKLKKSNMMGTFSIYFVLLALFFVSMLANENFATIGNLSNISRQIAVGTILAFGQTILIINGMLD